MRWTTVGGRRYLVYDTHAFAEQQPDTALLLIHGFGAESHRTFVAVARAGHALGLRSIAIDLPGHGVGSRSSATLAETAEHILAVLAAMEVRRVNVVAHSAGGAVAQELVAAASGVVDQLLLVGSAAEFRGRRLRTLFMVAPLLPLTAFRWGEWLYWHLRHAPLVTLDQRELMRLNDKSAMAQLARMLRTFNAPSIAGRCRITVIVLSEDEMIAPQHQRELARRCDARTLEIAARHNLPTHGAELFARYVLWALGFETREPAGTRVPPSGVLPGTRTPSGTPKRYVARHRKHDEGDRLTAHQRTGARTAPASRSEGTNACALQP